MSGKLCNLNGTYVSAFLITNKDIITDVSLCSHFFNKGKEAFFKSIVIMIKLFKKRPDLVQGDKEVWVNKEEHLTMV